MTARVRHLLAGAWRRWADRRVPHVAPDFPSRPVCAALWDTPMVQVNGDLTTCCLDEHLENRLGNVRTTTVAGLWSGETIHRWRVAQAEGRFADSGPLCTRCNWRSAGAMTPARLEDYLVAHGEHFALVRFNRRQPPESHVKRHPNRSTG